MGLMFRRPGHIELIRHRDGWRFLKTGVVQSVSVGGTLASSILSDGNASFDDALTAGFSARITVNLNSFQPALYAALASMAESRGRATNGEILTVCGLMPTLAIIDPGAFRVVEEFAVPMSAPHTVLLSRMPLSPQDIACVDEDNKPLAYVQGAPGSAQFAVSGRELTFNAADAGRELTVGYDATGIASGRLQMDEAAGCDAFQLLISGSAALGKDEGSMKIDALTFDRVMPTGDLPTPARRKEPEGWSLSFQLLKPRYGHKALDYVVEE